MKFPRYQDVKTAISVLWDSLQCPICMELMTKPISTKCDHQFCKFCMKTFLDSTKQEEAKCPVCKTKITKRSLQESPGFQRLIEGLQDMVHAYEHDTSTNYFTGVSMQRRQPHVKKHDTIQKLDNTSSHCFNHDEDLDHDALSRSNFSTLAAKDSFARLMGLEDSFSFTPEDEVTDAGCGDAPEISGEKEDLWNACKSNPPAEVLEPRMERQMSEYMEKTTSLPEPRSRQRTTSSADIENPLRSLEEEQQQQPIRQSSRNKTKKHMDHDRIFDWRQKESLDKVSEWLINITPTKANLETNEKVDICDLGDAASISGSCSTIEGKKQANSGGESHKRGGHTKGLQEQVFGAVYKRGQRETRWFSLKKKVNVASALLLPKETQTPVKVLKKRKSNKLKPAELGMQDCPVGQANVDLKEQPKLIHPKNTGHVDILEDTKYMFIGPSDGPNSNSTHKHVKETNEMQNNDDSKREDGDSPAFDVVLHQPETKLKKKMNIPWEDVSTDFHKQAETMSEKTEKNGSVKIQDRTGKAEKGKSVQLSKPFLMIGRKDECNPMALPESRPMLQETEVQIESCPSTPNSGALSRKSTRRSSRLQLLTKGVQKRHKKIVVPKSTIPVLDGNSMKQTEVDNVSKTLEHGIYLQNGKIGKSNKNGCVYHNDTGGVERMEATESTSSQMKATKAVIPVVEPSVSDVPNTGNPLKANVACFMATVPHSRSPMQATVENTVLEIPINPFVNSPNMRFNTAIETECHAVYEDKGMIKNMQQCERLVTPEVTHIESPCETSVACSVTVVPNSASPTEGIEQNLILECVNPTNQDTHLSHNMRSPGEMTASWTKSFTLEEDEDKNDSEMDTEQLLKTFKTTKRKSFCLGGSTMKGNHLLSEKGDNCGRKVPENNLIERKSRDKSSPHLALGLHTINSGVTFGLSPRDLPNLTAITSKQSKKKLEKIIKLDLNHVAGSISVAPPQKTCVENTETSLTPDGLVPLVQEIHQATEKGKGSELSSHCPVKSNTKKRRRMQQLKFSSKSDWSGSKEQSPLAQIISKEKESLRFLEVCVQDQAGSEDVGTHASACVPVIGAEAQRCLPACHSPDLDDSSQASLDLFGTPEECCIPVSDTNLSVQSSQFSTEILATQQRIAIQGELLRLEKMMALVSEVLQEKEGTSKETQVICETLPLQQSTTLTGHHLNLTLPCGQGMNLSSAREAARGTEGKPDVSMPGSTATDSLGPSQPTPSKHSNVAGMARQNDRHLEQSEHSSDPKRTSLQSRDKQTRRVLKGTMVSQQQEAKESKAQAAKTVQATHTSEWDRCRVESVLVSSGLGRDEQVMIKRFAKRVGGHVAPQVTAETTHIIIKTDGQLVCERTLKYFLGIAGRKWIVSYNWIYECFKQGKVLDEALFEIQGDVVNGSNHGGPMRARTTEDTNVLLKGYKICFQGQFTDMTTDQLEWMVEQCGATVIKDPLHFDIREKAHQMVIVQPAPEPCQSKYRALQTRAMIVSRGWLLDTVATYTLQNHSDYTL